MASENIQKQVAVLAKKIEGMSKEIEKLMPYAIIKQTTAFGNSSHVVLSRNFLDKRVGVIILGDKNE
jgi:putative transposon-encoded protein